MTSIVPSVAAVCLLSVPAPIVAQQTPATPPPVEKGSARATSGTPAPAAAPAPAPAPPYSYDPQGRRDPFVSLVARGSDPGSAATRPAGLPGLLIAEVAVKGIVRDRSGLIAMVQGPGTKTFIVRPGEKLMDGSVKAITSDSVVFSQDVNDPLSMVKQKEVRKTVRSADGGRE
jgi:type IV pilus assembly protein PilP